MKIRKFLEQLEVRIGFKPTYAELAEITGVSASALSNRYFNNGNIKDEEITKILKHYALEELGTGDNCITLDYYPDVFGSCGTGVFVPSEQRAQISLSKDCIADYSKCAHYSVINAIGDSMTPYIHDKDKLIVKHWDGEQIKDNGVYVFRYCDEIFVKRLSKNIDQIVIKSDNPIYDTRKIAVSKDFQIIGQIVGLLRDMR